MDGSNLRKRKGLALLKATSDFQEKVRRVLASEETVLGDEEKRVLEERTKMIRDTPKEIEFFAAELDKIWRGLDGKAMDALCRLIMAVIEDTYGFIRDHTSSECKLQAGAWEEDITDVVMRDLEVPFNTTSANAEMQDDTQPDERPIDEPSEDQTQLQIAGGAPDAMTELFSLLEETEAAEVKMRQKSSGHVAVFVYITQKRIKQFSDEHQLDINGLVRTVVQNTLDDWEDEECMGTLHKHMQSVIDITSRAPIVRRRIEILKEKYGGLVDEKESQPFDAEDSDGGM